MSFVVCGSCLGVSGGALTIPCVRRCRGLPIDGDGLVLNNVSILSRGKLRTYGTDCDAGLRTGFGENGTLLGKMKEEATSLQKSCEREQKCYRQTFGCCCCEKMVAVANSCPLLAVVFAGDCVAASD